MPRKAPKREIMMASYAIIEALNNEFDDPVKDYSEYVNDPIGFVENELNEVLTADVKTMLESVRDNGITVAISATGTGKTHGAARAAAWFYKVFPDSKVWTAAAPPEDNLIKLLWGEIGSIAAKHPQIFTNDKITTTNIQRLRNNKPAPSFITGLTIPSTGTPQERESRFSGKHAPHQLFVLDEGDAIPPEVYRGIEGCRSGDHERMLIMFNPRHQSGPVYQMIKNGTANVVHLSAFNHPNVISGENIIPGAVSRHRTVVRISDWCRKIHKDEPHGKDSFDLPDFLVGAQAKRESGVYTPPLEPGRYKVKPENDEFYYIVLGKYPPLGEQQLISREWIDAARSRYDMYIAHYGAIPPMGVSAIMGYDVAAGGKDFNALCTRYGSYVEPIDTWNGLDMPSNEDRVYKEYKSHDRVLRVNVDATGLGEGVAPHLHRRGCIAHGVKTASSPKIQIELGKFKNLGDELYWRMREWLRTDPGSMLPPDEYLVDELLTPTYEVKNGKVEIMPKQEMKEKLLRSPDKMEALRMTFYEPEGAFANCSFT